MLSHQIDRSGIDVDGFDLLRLLKRDVLHTELLGQPLGDLDIGAETRFPIDSPRRLLPEPRAEDQSLLQLILGEQLLLHEDLAQLQSELLSYGPSGIQRLSWGGSE